MNKMIRLGAPAVLALMAMPTSAWAFAAWSNASGTAPLFSWSNGYNNDVNLFGSPSLSSNSFVFTPQNFAAISTGGNFANASDTLQVTITVNPGQTITGVLVQEFGTRTSATATVLQGTERVKDLTVGGLSEQTAQVTLDAGVPNWNGTSSVTGLSFGGGLTFQFTLTNSLQAGFGAEIHKNGVIITFLPAPGTLAIGSLLGLAAFRRRR